MKFKSFNLILAFLLGAVSAQNTWVPAAPLPEPRAGQAVVVLDSLIFVIGGSSSGQHHGSNAMWSYNPATDTWNTGYPALHHERTNHVAISVGDTIWVFGGQHTNSIVAEIERYVLGAAAWENVGEMPVPRRGMGIARLGNEFYLMGGKTSNGMFALPTDRVDRYDFCNGTWTEGTPMSQGRANFGYAIYGDTIMVAGGSYLDPLLSAERYTPGGGWASLPDLDSGHGNAAAVVLSSRFILIGGFSVGGQNMSNLELSNNQWIEFPGLGLPRYSHSAVVYDNTIHVIGGRNGQQTLTSHETYTVSLSLDRNVTFPAGYGISLPYPNPFNSTLHFTLELPPFFQGNGTLKITDLLGREAARKSLRNMRNGDRLRVDFSTLATDLPSGAYFLTIRWETPEAHIQTSPRRVIYLK